MPVIHSRRIGWLLATALATAVAPASADGLTAADGELAEITGLLPGLYSGDFIAPEGAPMPGPATLYHKIVRVEAPRFGKLVYYHQISRAGFDGVPFQQKLYVFDTSPGREHNSMQPFVLPVGKVPVNLDWHPETLRDLEPAATQSFPRTCDIRWQAEPGHFVARVRREDCSYYSEHFQATIAPDLAYTLSAGSFGLKDDLYGEDGTAVVFMPEMVVADRRAEVTGR